MFRVLASTAVIGLLGGAAAVYHQAPEIAAGALLHPARTTVAAVRPANCVDRDYTGDGVTLTGWECAAEGRRRGTVVYLHGIADNRGSAVGAILRFTTAGYDVLAYDSRAHGQSGGDVCTYGFYEKIDLQRVLDTVSSGPIVLVGTSLGAAVALQAAADDRRITGVIAAEVFASLEEIARERAPFFVWERLIRDAFEVAESRGVFRIADVDPEAAARRIQIPILLVHGNADVETPPAHSHRVYAALAGPKRLILVPGAGHNQSLHNVATWQEIDRWVDANMRGV